MLEAITKGLEKKPAGDRPTAAKDGAGDAGKAAKPAADAKKPDADAAKGAKGEELGTDGKPKEKKPEALKSSSELDLTAEEKKVLGAKAQQRFGEVINTLKARESTIAELTQANTGLKEARDAILGVMEESRTSQDQLATYLDFNAKITSGDPKQLEEALAMVEEQRALLYQALGREPEGAGVDLLKDFPDLVKQVEDEEITRKAALEIATARRERNARQAAQQRREQQTSQQTQTAQQHKQAAEEALSGIEAWTAKLQKSDLDYKAKEDKLLAKLNHVMTKYPPDKWLETLQLLYEGIVITKAPGGGETPIRPRHDRPGQKAPTRMLDAINQGLGYPTGG